VRGAGAIAAIWLRLSPEARAALDSLWLCMEWDGRRPDVEAPVGFFFGVGVRGQLAARRAWADTGGLRERLQPPKWCGEEAVVTGTVVRVPRAVFALVCRTIKKSVVLMGAFRIPRVRPVRGKRRLLPPHGRVQGRRQG
jgi:hypothetical protein